MESFIDEMKRYLGFNADEIALLRQLGPRLEKHFPEMAERFYSQIPHHPNAFRVFTGGETQIARLKNTLQEWARGLFRGVYDDGIRISATYVSTTWPSISSLCSRSRCVLWTRLWCSDNLMPGGSAL